MINGLEQGMTSQFFRHHSLKLAKSWKTKKPAMLYFRVPPSCHVPRSSRIGVALGGSLLPSVSTRTPHVRNDRPDTHAHQSFRFASFQRHALERSQNEVTVTSSCPLINVNAQHMYVLQIRIFQCLGSNLGVAA